MERGTKATTTLAAPELSGNSRVRSAPDFSTRRKMLVQISNQQTQKTRDEMILRIYSFPMLDQRQDSHLIHIDFLSRQWGTPHWQLEQDANRSFLSAQRR